MALASVRGAGIGPEEERFSGGVIDRVHIFPGSGEIRKFRAHWIKLFFLTFKFSDLIIDLIQVFYKVFS